MDYGYVGKILRVDLSKGTYAIDHIDSGVNAKFLGGRGLGIWCLGNETRGEVEPFSEDNPLIFMTGPYTGTGVFSAFYNVTTRSPLTGLAASSHSGGSWGPMLKRAGFDAVIVRGKAERPVYLLIQNESCRILDAKDLWGKGARETDLALQGQHGKVAVAAIGPAGENLVKYAAIMNDIHRTTGRSGVGAVMGAKRLKAVVVGGDHKVTYYDRDEFVKLSQKGGKQARENAKAFAKYGTSMVFSLMNEKGALPTFYFKAGHFEHAHKINGEALKSRYWVRDKGCFNCPLRCANIHTVSEGPYQVEETEGPEYETMMAFGSNCGNADPAGLIKINDVCNNLGVDTISAGGVISLLFYLNEKGVVTSELVNDLDLSWGNVDTILTLLEWIAYRKQIGDVLAEGSVKTAEYFGEEWEGHVIHTKNQDFPGYEVRRAHGTGLSFATSSRGACHLRGCMYVNEIFSGEVSPYGLGPEKVRLLVEKENMLALVDSLVMCKFGQRNGGFTVEVLPQVLKSLIGIDYSADDLRKIGERAYNCERLYNLVQGVGPDVLPERLFEEDCEDPLDGGTRISRGAFQDALKLYYRERGWDDTGRPGASKVAELGLEDFAVRQA